MSIKTKLIALTLAVLTVLCVVLPLVSEATRATADTLPTVVPTPPTEAVTEKTDVPTETPTDEPSDRVPSEELTVTVLITEENRVAEMPLEDYVVCVVCAEMPYTFNTEALKAQAIAARTYCIYKIREGSTHEGGADACTDHSHCAAYVSRQELVDRYGETVTKSIITKITDAVRQTEGQILTYNGEAILAVYHSRSYKFTEASKNVWGGDLPYLRSVSTPESDSITTVTVSEKQMRELFSTDAAIPVGAVSSSVTSTVNDSGRQDTLVLWGKAIKAKALRSAFGLRSTAFEYERSEDGWIFTVHGYGHGVGMSQYGANEMAKNGQDCYAILTHYYSGVSVTPLS